MALSAQEIDNAVTALQSALASGELTVEYNGRRVTYRSSSEIVSALDYFTRLAQGVPSTGPVSATLDRGSYVTFERD
jgi:hypothetical protein